MALGATATDVYRAVVVQGARVAAIGVATGVLSSSRACFASLLRQQRDRRQPYARRLASLAPNHAATALRTDGNRVRGRVDADSRSLAMMLSMASHVGM